MAKAISPRSSLIDGLYIRLTGDKEFQIPVVIGKISVNKQGITRSFWGQKDYITLVNIYNYKLSVVQDGDVFYIMDEAEQSDFDDPENSSTVIFKSRNETAVSEYTLSLIRKAQAQKAA